MPPEGEEAGDGVEAAGGAHGDGGGGAGRRGGEVHLGCRLRVIEMFESENPYSEVQDEVLVDVDVMKPMKGRGNLKSKQPAGLQKAM